mgnify:CR=1 FL=1
MGKKLKNDLLTFSISHFLNLQYSEFASYSGVRYNSLVSKAYGYHSGCNLIFSLSRRMLDLFGVIIMMGNVLRFFHTFCLLLFFPICCALLSAPALCSCLRLYAASRALLSPVQQLHAAPALRGSLHPTRY